MTRFGEGKLGSCGKPLPGVEIRLLEDGEILLKSPWLMRGYRDRPEATREALDDEGWLHTGDVGRLDDDGDLTIIDRKKELIINAFGKNMSPANIEFRLKESHPLIGQAAAIGDDQRYVVALLTLDPETAPRVAPSLGLKDLPLEELAEHPRVLEIVGDAVAQANTRLSRVEQIKKFKLLGAEWLPGGDELTPTMKLKRKPIAAKYEQEVAALYATD
jgi:long-subunit acyl-CoA synthetase (AMP-forming)